jgi:long-chain fatty acid transport protein
MHYKTHSALLATLTTVAAFGASNIHAAAIEFASQSAANLGTAGAGASSAGEDASSAWYNPAAMTQLKGQNLSLSGTVTTSSMRFNDQGSTTAAGSAYTNLGGNAGGVSLVPALYYTRQLNDKLTAGFAFNVPFARITDYDDKWIGRFQSDKTKIESFNLNPSLGFKVSDQLSLGAGISVQKLDAEFTRKISAFGEHDGKLKVDSWSYGFNVGALFKPTDRTNIGLTYRSQVKHNTKGTAEFGIDPNTPAAVAASLRASRLANGDIKADITLPSSTALSVTHWINNKMSIRGELTYIGWSSIDKLDFQRSNGDPLSNTPLNLKDTYRAAIGGTYQYNDRTILRTGLAFDKSPVDNSNRALILPDSDRTWFSAGLGYKVNPQLSIDAAYMYVKFAKAQLNNYSWNSTPATSGGQINNPNAVGNMNGYYDSDAHQFAVQANYKF